MIVEEFVIASVGDDVINLGCHASTVHAQGMVSKEGLRVTLPPTSIVKPWRFLESSVDLPVLVGMLGAMALWNERRTARCGAHT